ncbi:MAG TPA: hypothetical protein VGC27_05095 [Rhizomicrobium sp.]
MLRLAVIGIVTAPILGIPLWQVWDLIIRPRLIPIGEIKALADTMIAKHGLRAEEMAFVEEDRAWRYSDAFEQGKWHRVRRELWRRYEAGKWKGPEEQPQSENPSDVSI